MVAVIAILSRSPIRTIVIVYTAMP
jgi:hypothetical protein